MSYNRGFVNSVGGGYPANAGNMPYGQHQQQPMHPIGQPPPQQYAPTYHRVSSGGPPNVWNTPPQPYLPPNQVPTLNTWSGNNLPQQPYRGGYQPMNDNRNLKQQQPPLRLSQNKRPREWNSPAMNKSIRLMNQQGQNQQNKQQQIQNQQSSINKQQQQQQQQNKPTSGNWNNKSQKNFQNKRRNNQQQQQQGKPNENKRNSFGRLKKEYPLENVSITSSGQPDFNEAQKSCFLNITGFLCHLCDVFIKDKVSAIEHSNQEPHLTKYKEFKEKEAKEKEAKDKEAQAQENGTKSETSETEKSETVTTEAEATPAPVTEQVSTPVEEAPVEETKNTQELAEKEETEQKVAAVVEEAKTSETTEVPIEEASKDNGDAVEASTNSTEELINDEPNAEITEAPEVASRGATRGAGRGRGRGRNRGRSRR